LSHYGQHLTSLKLAQFVLPLQQLSCPELLELQLKFSKVQLGPTADGQPGVIQGCSKLTRLELQCDIIDFPQGTELDGGLSSLVHLQHLDVQLTSFTQFFVGVSHVLLPRLQHLTYLRVQGMSVDNLLQLGCLTGLQELHLLGAPGVVIGPSCVPGLAFPASLQQLVIVSTMEAAVLSLVPTGLQRLYVSCKVEAPADGPGSLLYGIARLQHLTELSLECFERAIVAVSHEALMPPAGAVYSALTASTKLCALDLSGFDLPQGSWPHIFPVGRLLPNLTSLKLGIFRDESGTAKLVGATDLSSLVSICPSLCSIDTWYLQPGLHVSELHRLTALTHVDVKYLSRSYSSCEDGARGLAAVTQLRHLNVQQCGLGRQTGCLLPLTSLTALTKLVINGGSGDFPDSIKLQVSM
jgi:hypothetical protein